MVNVVSFFSSFQPAFEKIFVDIVKPFYCGLRPKNKNAFIFWLEAWKFYLLQ